MDELASRAAISSLTDASRRRRSRGRASAFSESRDTLDIVLSLWRQNSRSGVPRQVWGSSLRFGARGSPARVSIVASVSLPIEIAKPFLCLRIERRNKGVDKAFTAAGERYCAAFAAMVLRASIINALTACRRSSPCGITGSSGGFSRGFPYARSNSACAARKATRSSSLRINSTRRSMASRLYCLAVRTTSP